VRVRKLFTIALIIVLVLSVPIIVIVSMTLANLSLVRVHNVGAKNVSVTLIAAKRQFGQRQMSAGDVSYFWFVADGDGDFHLDCIDGEANKELVGSGYITQGMSEIYLMDISSCDRVAKRRELLSEVRAMLAGDRR
jgi:hypothetical protein